MKTKTFETFRNLEDSYFVNQLKKEEASNVNFLDYRKYKVTIELIEEHNDILLERLENILKESKGIHSRERVRKEILKLNQK